MFNVAMITTAGMFSHAYAWVCPACHVHHLKAIRQSCPEATLSSLSCRDNALCTACRTAVEMQAAAASTVRPLQQAGQGTAEASAGPAGTRSVEGAAGPFAQAQPRWDCNDGDTWHKRQQVSLCTQMQRLYTTA